MELLVNFMILMSFPPMYQCVQESDILSRNPDNDRQQCLNGEMLFQELTSSKIKCAMICRPLSDCKQIFYDESTQICMGCLSFDCQAYHSSTSVSYGKPVPPEYVGCYADYSTRVLNGYRVDPPALTNELCQKTCYDMGFAYAATQNARHCFCGDSYNSHEISEEHYCYETCNGDASQICGGPWRNSIYRVRYT